MVFSTMLHENIENKNSQRKQTFLCEREKIPIINLTLKNHELWFVLHAFQIKQAFFILEFVTRIFHNL